MIRITCVLLGLLSLGAMEVSTQTPVAELLRCMQDNAPDRLKISRVRLQSLSESPGPVVEASYVSQGEKDGFRAMLRVIAPADFAGTRYLLIESGTEMQRYVYLPSVGKVRRVFGAGSDAGIAGTSLRFSDLRLIAQALNASSILLQDSATLSGRPVDILKFTPALADSPFHRARLAVDRETCVVLRAEFEQDEQLLRRYLVEPDSLKRSGQFDYGSVATIEDRRERRKIRISLDGVETNMRIPGRIFDPRRFHQQSP